jgi:iron complex outermembrane receptor protein
MFRATDALQIGVNGAYTKASVKNDFEATVIPQDAIDVILNSGLAGDRLPYIPEWSWSAVAEYAFSLSGGYAGQVGGALRWVGDRVNDTTERQLVTAAGDPSTVLQETITPPLEIGSYSALDLYAGIGRNNWGLRAYVNNVTGEKAWSSIAPIDSQLTGARVQLAAVPIQPRTFGVELDFRF